jgi:hypothetical protein
MAVGITALASIAVLRFNRAAMRLASTFPELLKVPLLGKFLT